MHEPARLRRFVAEVEALVGAHRDEAPILDGCRAAMRRLVEHDDWLPREWGLAHPQHFQQYLLHGDPAERFCVVSVVWGPGHGTPVHDHTVWGVIGVLRGAERCTRYRIDDGLPRQDGETVVFRSGEVDVVSPHVGDIHRVANAFDDRDSISIHAYGANIARLVRHAFDADGKVTEFMSSYANAPA